MSHLHHQDAHFREAWELVMNSSPISAVGAVLKARDAMLARCVTQLERMLAAQGDTPDAELIALQHEIATHLAVPPVAGAMTPLKAEAIIATIVPGAEAPSDLRPGKILAARDFPPRQHGRYFG